MNILIIINIWIEYKDGSIIGNFECKICSIEILDCDSNSCLDLNTNDIKKCSKCTNSKYLTTNK